MHDSNTSQRRFFTVDDMTPYFRSRAREKRICPECLSSQLEVVPTALNPNGCFDRCPSCGYFQVVIAPEAAMVPEGWTPKLDRREHLVPYFQAMQDEGIWCLGCCEGRLILAQDLDPRRVVAMCDNCGGWDVLTCNLEQVMDRKAGIRAAAPMKPWQAGTRRQNEDRLESTAEATCKMIKLDFGKGEQRREKALSPYWEDVEKRGVRCVACGGRILFEPSLNPDAVWGTCGNCGASRAYTCEPGMGRIRPSRRKKQAVGIKVLRRQASFIIESK